MRRVAAPLRPTGFPLSARSSATPVDLGAQSDLIGAPESVSTEAVLAAPIGGRERPTVCVSDRGGFHGVGIRPSK
jgi:hypothetical protein